MSNRGKNLQIGFEIFQSRFENHIIRCFGMVQVKLYGSRNQDYKVSVCGLSLMMEQVKTVGTSHLVEAGQISRSCWLFVTSILWHIWKYLSSKYTRCHGRPLPSGHWKSKMVKAHWKRSNFSSMTAVLSGQQLCSLSSSIWTLLYTLAKTKFCYLNQKGWTQLWWQF